MKKNEKVKKINKNLKKLWKIHLAPLERPILDPRGGVREGKKIKNSKKWGVQIFNGPFLAKIKSENYEKITETTRFLAEFMETLFY